MGGPSVAGEKATPAHPVGYRPGERMNDTTCPHGDFRLTNPGFTVPHDIGCLCKACVDRRRRQAKDPQFRAIVEKQAAKLPPEQAVALIRAFGLTNGEPWWRRLPFLR